MPPAIDTPGPVVKNPPAKAGDCQTVTAPGKIPWRRKWQTTSVFLPRKPHGQRSLVGCSPWSRKRVRHDLATKEQILPDIHLKTICCSPDYLGNLVNCLWSLLHTLITTARKMLQGKEREKKQKNSQLLPPLLPSNHPWVPCISQFRWKAVHSGACEMEPAEVSPKK